MFFEIIDRKIIPRWRDLRTTVALGELKFPTAPNKPPASYDSLVRKIHEWQSNKTPWFASDLIAAAFVLGKHELALDAGQFIVESAARCPKAAVKLARIITGEDSDQWAIPELEGKDLKETYRRIHAIKLRLREQPRNSVAWVELARRYTIVGQTDQAARAIHIACALSPTNRFVLRSAARFLSHSHEPKDALRLLRAASSIYSDPWLVGTEIGVASVAKVTPRFVKLGRAMLNNANFSALSTSELASALGTLEFESGRTQIAKRLFRKSLVQPTENSVAQAEWVSRGLAGLEVDVTKFDVPRTYEALAWDSFNKAGWESAVAYSNNWLKDQPFSARPAIFGSYISSGALERYEDSIGIIRTSLIPNRGDPSLINNLAFALASTGRVQEAEEELTDVDEGQLTPINSVALVATKGLICFRKGMFEEGRRLYLEAMELAERKSLPKYRGMAALYLAREEMVANTPMKTEALQRALVESKGQSDPDFLAIFSRVTRMANTTSSGLPTGAVPGESKGSQGVEG